MKKIILYVFILNILNNNYLAEKLPLKDWCKMGVDDAFYALKWLGALGITALGVEKFYYFLHPEKKIYNLEQYIKELEADPKRTTEDKVMVKARYQREIDELKEKIAVRELKKKKVSQITDKKLDQSELLVHLSQPKGKEGFSSFPLGETARNRNYEIPQAYLFMERATSTMSFLMLNIFKNQSTINTKLFSPDHHYNPFL